MRNCPGYRCSFNYRGILTRSYVGISGNGRPVVEAEFNLFKVADPGRQDNTESTLGNVGHSIFSFLQVGYIYGSCV